MFYKRVDLWDERSIQDHARSRFYPGRWLSTLCLYLDGLYSWMISVLLRLLQFRYQQRSSDSAATKGRVWTVSSDIDWKRTPGTDAAQTYRDELFGSVMSALGTDYDLVTTHAVDIRPRSGVRAALGKCRDKLGRFVGVNTYWSPRIWRAQRDAFRHFRHAWKQIEADPRLRELSTVDGVDRYAEIKRLLGFHFQITLPMAHKYYLMGRAAICDLKPDLLLVKNEYGWRERGFAIAAAHEQDVPTIALQHGNIYARHPGYVYSPSEVSETGDHRTPFCPLPRLTLVYGEADRELLTGIGNYPHDTVRVTGAPRYDHLALATNAYPRERYAEKYGLDPGRDIVLWTTQCHGLSDDENRRTIDEVLRAVTAVGAQLVIKQHPREGAKYTRWLERAVAKHSAVSVIVPKGSDIYEHIVCSDILISKYSTTVTEALILDKPVVILNLGFTADRVNYVQDGVAHGAYSAGELTQVLERMQNNDSSLRDGRDRFRSRSLHGNDGQATARVASIVRELLDRRHG